MPTAVQLERCQEIRRWFQGLRHRVRSRWHIRQLWPEFREKFPEVSKDRWSKFWVQEFGRMLSQEPSEESEAASDLIAVPPAEDQPVQIHEIAIPANLDDGAKQAINALVKLTDELRAELDRRGEALRLHEEQARQDKASVAFLKKLTIQCLEQY